MQQNFHRESINYFWITIGSLLFCAGLNLFIVPVGLYNGGTVGVSQIIRTLLQSRLVLPTGFDIAGILNLLLNLPLLALAFRQFGRPLFLKTVYSVLTQTAFFSFLPIPAVPILPDRLTACIIGGLLAGAGVGLTLRAGGSGGGNDIIGLYMAKKHESFSVGRMTLIINGIIYFICALLFELPTALYSIIYSAVCALVTDHFHLQNINMNVQIFTKDPDLYQVILQQLGRGVTYWKAVGGYTETDTYVIITVISKYEIAPLRQMLLEKDPNAFMIMSEGPDIFGNFEKRL